MQLAVKVVIEEQVYPLCCERSAQCRLQVLLVCRKVSAYFLNSEGIGLSSRLLSFSCPYFRLVISEESHYVGIQVPMVFSFVVFELKGGGGKDIIEVGGSWLAGVAGEA